MNAAKTKGKDYNKFLREKTPYLLAGVEKASLQDFVLILSSFGIRLTKNKQGAKDLFKSQFSRDLISDISSRICQADMIHSGANIKQLASLLWAFSMMPT